MPELEFNIQQVAEILGLERNPHEKGNPTSFNVRCPLCDKKHYHLNIDVRKGVWRCAKCGESGGTIGLYVRFGLNESKYTKELGRKAVSEIKEQLALGLSTAKTGCLSVEYFEDDTHRSDTELDNVYRALLGIPKLHLIFKHRDALLKRGLSDKDIENNRYRSLPEVIYFPKGRIATLDEYRGKNFEGLYSQYPELKRLGKRNIISGLYIGTYLNNYLKINLEGIPGFFKIKNLWCFKYTSGLLIPVRNISGQIVNLQIRKASGGLRYITNSSKGYNKGTTGSCRVHFPINNPEIGPHTVIYLTEGALKADVALSLTRNPNIAYAALLGVNATKDLQNIIRMLKDKGCTRIVNAFDIDKITNPNVAKANMKIKRMIDNMECFQYTPLFWDKRTAQTVMKVQNELLREHNINVKYPVNNIFYKVLCNTIVLHKQRIEFDSAWPNKNTKGIDDYLKFLQT